MPTEQPEVFPTDAFEFDDPNVETTPEIKTKSPWLLLADRLKSYDVLPLSMNCLEGLAASNNATDSDFDIDFTKGHRRDSTRAVNMVAAALTKKMDEKFVAGTGAGGADLGMTIDKASLTTNVVTIATKAAHGLTNASTVLIANLNVEAHMNGKFVIASVPTPTTFTYALTHGNVAEASATQGVVIACSVGAVATRPNAPYYAYVGLNGSTVDIFFSYSAVGATPPTGYTYFRMILGFMVDTDGHILPGTWSEGNRKCMLLTTVACPAVTVDNTRRLLTIPAPPNSEGIFDIEAVNATGNGGGWFLSTADANVAVADYTSIANNIYISVSLYITRLTVAIDASSQIAYRLNQAGAALTCNVRLKGFWLPFGAFNYP